MFKIIYKFVLCCYFLHLHLKNQMQATLLGVFGNVTSLSSFFMDILLGVYLFCSFICQCEHSLGLKNDRFAILYVAVTSKYSCFFQPQFV